MLQDFMGDILKSHLTSSAGRLQTYQEGQRIEFPNPDVKTVPERNRKNIDVNHQPNINRENCDTQQKVQVSNVKSPSTTQEQNSVVK
jgi:hypothetical protein